MSWKDWPYWLKGSIIFFAIHLVIASIFLGMYYPDSQRPGAYDLILIPIIQLDFTIYTLAPLIEPFIVPFKQNPYQFYSNMIYIIGSIQWILIGALIGHIYGKIKGRSSSQ